MEMDYLKRAEELFEETVRRRRALHQIPEIGLDLPQTTEFIMEELVKMGYEPKRCGGGVIATVGKPGGKTILLRGDIDVLPMAEESGLEFASKNGCAHACGHDMHGAMLMTAARMLKENEDSLAGTVKLMFQPAEETFQGADAMIADGVLENPRPDTALAYHVGLGQKPFASFAYNSEGTLMSSSDNFKVVVHGVGTHGGYPHLGVDSINIAIHIVLGFESIIARETIPARANVISIGKIVAGDANNIIPDSVEMYGTLRCDTNEQREFIIKRMREVIENVARAYRGTAELVISSGAPALVCDKGSMENFVSYMREIDIPGREEYPGTYAAASEDMAVLLSEIPGAYMMLYAAFPDGGNGYNAHHPKVVFNEEIMKVGPAYLAHCATRWLEEHK